MEQVFHYPTFNQIHRHANPRGLRAAKFLLRRTLMAGSVRRFESAVNGEDFLQTFFCGSEAEAYPLLHTFADRRFGVRQRLQTMLADIRAVHGIFGTETFNALAGGEMLALAQLPDAGITLYLHRNDISCHEGYWALSLRDAGGDRLYSASWVLLPDGQLLIASVQGPRGENAKDRVRLLTKQLHYLRPQQLLIIAGQYFAALITGSAALGIAQARQVKRRFALKRRMHVDYDAVWAEHQAQRGQDGYWHLPAEPVRKAPEDISSRKRAQYRRRYAMLDTLQAEMAATLHAARCKAP